MRPWANHATPPCVASRRAHPDRSARLDDPRRIGRRSSAGAQARRGGPGDGRRDQPIRWIQPNGSAARPVWMSEQGVAQPHRDRARAGRRRPSTRAVADLTEPTGVTTAAVPHANTSEISPAGVAGLPVLDRDPTLLGRDAQVRARASAASRG